MSQARRRGVVAFSSGNFGQGLAAACMFEQVKCTIVMPEDAPVSKEERARSYGADVVRAAALPVALAHHGAVSLGRCPPE